VSIEGEERVVWVWSDGQRHPLSNVEAVKDRQVRALDSAMTPEGNPKERLDIGNF
jgi:hypothetical protein